MKPHLCFLTCLTVLALTSAVGQQAPTPAPPPVRAPAPPPAQTFTVDPATGLPVPPVVPLTRFDLDFPGGSPRALVAAVSKAMGRPLNAIVPDEFNDVQLPALKMNHVDVSDLFQALEATSRKSEAVSTGNSGRGGFGSYQFADTSYGFRTQGRFSDDSIWYFSVNKPALPPPSSPKPNLEPPKACRFYPLAPYLERGATVDDITTAIQTGWKMLGDTSPPAVSFHKETKLLIAVGEPSKLATIDDVLKALREPPGPAAVGWGVSAPRPSEKPKAQK